MPEKCIITQYGDEIDPPSILLIALYLVRVRHHERVLMLTLTPKEVRNAYNDPFNKDIKTFLERKYGSKKSDV